jgi:hypothetical protein
MLELTTYGLMGLAAMLVIAFYFAYGDEFPPAREKSSCDLINNAHSNDSQMIETGTGNPQFRRTVGKQWETAPASLLQTTSPAETGPGAIYSDSFQSDRGPLEAFHG